MSNCTSVVLDQMEHALLNILHLCKLLGHTLRACTVRALRKTGWFSRPAVYIGRVHWIVNTGDDSPVVSDHVRFRATSSTVLLCARSKTQLLKLHDV